MKKFIRLTLVLLGAALPGALVCSAETFTQRIGKNEIYLLANYWTADDQTMSNVTLPTPIPGGTQDTTADIRFNLKEEVFWGFGYIYNFSDNLAVRAEMTFGSPEYTMDWSTIRGHGEAYINTGKLNVDYHFGHGAIRPFVSAGIGYLYMDTGIPDGPVEFWIYWSYWWGYTVVATQSTVSDTFFTYNAAAGLSWDINPKTVMKLAVTGNWADTDRGTWETLETSLSIGWRF
jgi:opacity protein-like surface antigen